MAFLFRIKLVIEMLDETKLYSLMRDKYIKNIRELSKKCKVPYTTLVYMLSGHDMHVSTLIELAKFFNVPIDYLVKKSYGIMSYTEDKEIFIPTSSILEATLSTIM